MNATSRVMIADYLTVHDDRETTRKLLDALLLQANKLEISSPYRVEIASELVTIYLAPPTTISVK